MLDRTEVSQGERHARRFVHTVFIFNGSDFGHRSLVIGNDYGFTARHISKTGSNVSLEIRNTRPFHTSIIGHKKTGYKSFSFFLLRSLYSVPELNAQINSSTTRSRSLSTFAHSPDCGSITSCSTVTSIIGSTGPRQPGSGFSPRGVPKDAANERRPLVRKLSETRSPDRVRLRGYLRCGSRYGRRRKRPARLHRVPRIRGSRGG